ncbi:hypothetical protein NADFUDRAFT_52084 [Nadsonia fulvescens var. elongata DSM 6958]|uniref:DUF7702 domain-containing protein n=1 Tax=Nadsonia fulvescens var. elongata DSM 6958 TaxID=857566 RepID=A0A1E3PJ67_9ASCO|nr:hypothetical protein NADFUDRAFT_52084 [Nadsonia fulvescens var. elongata DSM 6958]
MANVSLGPLQHAVLSFVQKGAEYGKETNRPLVPKHSEVIIPATIVTAVVLASAGFSIESSNYPDNSGAGITLVKISSILFIVAFILILCLSVFLYHRIDISFSRVYVPYLYALFASAFFFTAKLVYFTCSAFNTTTDPNHINKFSPYTGQWEFLLGMGFIMELAIVTIFCIATIKIEYYSSSNLENLSVKEEVDSQCVKLV